MLGGALLALLAGCEEPRVEVDYSEEMEQAIADDAPADDTGTPAQPFDNVATETGREPYSPNNPEAVVDDEVPLEEPGEPDPAGG